MSIIKQSDAQVFELELIGRGDFIHARQKKTGEERNGLVFKAEPEKLTVLHTPAISNVSAFFYITPAEVANGEWALRWSHDLTTVWEEGGEP